METLEVQICIHVLFNIVADANRATFLDLNSLKFYIKFLLAFYPRIFLYGIFYLLDVRLIEQIIIHIIFASFESSSLFVELAKFCMDILSND